MIQLNWYQVAILIGAIQATVLIVLLLRKTDNRKANYLLAVVLLIIGRMDITDLVPDRDLAQQYPLIIVFFDEYLCTLGVLLYFYVQSLTQANFKFNRSFWQITGFTLAIDATINIVRYYCFISKACPKNAFILFLEVFDIVTIFIVATSLVLAFITLQKHEKSIKGRFTNLEKVTLQWLQNFMKVLGLLAVYWALMVLTDILVYDYKINDVFYHISSISLVCLVYWIGFSQYMRPPMVIVEQLPPKIVFKDVARSKQHHATPKTHLNNSEMQHYAQLLQEAMQQHKLYLDSTLSLNSLAIHLNISPKHISQTLNQFIGKNLNDFVNEYRIEEVKQKLLDSKYAHLTILGIAFEAGFNSKATFQRMFKKVAKVSPSEFKKQQQANTQR